MFEPKQWVHAENITVQQFCDYLTRNVPGDALFCVCGTSQIYMHVETDGGVFSVDDNSLSNLEEYRDYEIGEMEERDVYRN